MQDYTSKSLEENHIGPNKNHVPQTNVMNMAGFRQETKKHICDKTKKLIDLQDFSRQVKHFQWGTLSPRKESTQKGDVRVQGGCPRLAMLR